MAICAIEKLFQRKLAVFFHLFKWIWNFDCEESRSVQEIEKCIVLPWVNTIIRNVQLVGDWNEAVSKSIKLVAITTQAI